jgi:hypothetical protein
LPFYFYHFLFATKIFHLLAPSCYPHYSALSLPFNFFASKVCSMFAKRKDRSKKERTKSFSKIKNDEKRLFFAGSTGLQAGQTGRPPHERNRKLAQYDRAPGRSYWSAHHYSSPAGPPKTTSIGRSLLRTSPDRSPRSTRALRSHRPSLHTPRSRSL